MKKIARTILIFALFGLTISAVAQQSQRTIRILAQEENGAPISAATVTPNSSGKDYTVTVIDRLTLGENLLESAMTVKHYSQGKVATNEQRQVNLSDNLSVTKAGRQLKFGVDYRWLAPFSSPVSYRQFAQFSGVTATPGGALSGTALFAQSGATQSNALLSQNFSLYGQDTWKITPRLTVTYGLRWEVNPPLKGKNSAKDPFTVTGLDNPATMTLAPRGTPLYDITYGNVAPRLGLAYQLNGSPNWRATLRAGVGVFYDLGQGSLGGVTSYFPYSATKNFSPSPFPLSPQNAAPPAFTVNPPVATMVVADPHLKLPRSYQWNLALEQSKGAQYPGGKIFNRAAFSTSPAGQQGNFGRNVLRGFGASQADVALQRRFLVTEKVGLRFRAEFFRSE